ncbi:patatin-like phospholipase family protein [Haloarcula salinisoli]|uniref:Patatin-like phospholipase family protein n=1 Tax=Haloarcula salinisoli TaxID=2487746 RepID=A0A8J7YC67_9EURY|nr:patatin-like phospholipase family protein [Halomicroarcula salinisoli]MBX0303375.1 patatin-like phospholipase family protein [Halomicroarcula salinisoli]
MASTETRRVAIACQGGGSHTAFTAGVLSGVIRHSPADYDVTALSGTSGGAVCAMLAWQGLRRSDPEAALASLSGFWEDISAETVLERGLNAGLVFANRFTDEFGSVAVSPYYNPASDFGRAYLRRLLDRYVDIEQSVTAGESPDLYISAVDVLSGQFTVFENGDGGLDAVVASATIPNIYEATEIDGDYYWDGLFAQNPPIRHFTAADDPDEKPDEIWLVRINPRRTRTVPRSMNEILDRRNELAGNLSLEQELHTVGVINRFIANDVITDDRYKRIDVREVTLDWDLDYHSKLDRDPALIDDLFEYGRERASELWTPPRERD